MFYFVGFAKEIDWRPTEIIDLQAIAPCRICRVVTREMYVLDPSAEANTTVSLEWQSGDRHTPDALCTCCYVSAKTSDGNLMAFRRQEYELKDILGLQIKCWNSNNGCDFTGTLSDTLDHFHGECRFHQITCPVCDATVLYHGMFLHAKEEKCRQQNHTEATEEQTTLEKLLDSQAALQGSLNNMMAKIRLDLRDLEYSVSAQIRELGLIRTKQDEHHLTYSANLADIRGALTRFPALIRHQPWLRKTCATVLQLTKDKFLWSVEDVCYHMDSAIHADAVRINSDCFMFDGYNVRLRVTISKRLTELSVAIHMCLCPGPRDDAIEWPFRTPFTLALVHPKNAAKSSVKLICPEQSPFPECFERPLMTENSGVGGSCFTTGRMLAGFLVDDAILIALERMR